MTQLAIGCLKDDLVREFILALESWPKGSRLVKDLWEGVIHPGMALNELVIHEIRNNASAIYQKFIFSCCKIEFVQVW